MWSTIKRPCILLEFSPWYHKIKKKGKERKEKKKAQWLVIRRGNGFFSAGDFIFINLGLARWLCSLCRKSARSVAYSFL
jgi:hypothetical protein